MILTGDSLDKLKTLEDNSIDSIVTDPPYGLSFMGKKWDYDVPSVELWEQVFRVLKPGGHLLSFAGSRTYHRMAVNIEDAGFEIRDQIMWVYGSGFPKSLNIGKAVDKIQGNEREEMPNPLARQQTASKEGTIHGSRGANTHISKGTSPYEGWGTALKPAHEPIVVARKPISEKNIAQNVLKWGTGGINIDESRVEGESWGKRTNGSPEGKVYELGIKGGTKQESNPQGRFPANFIHDGSDEATELLGDAARFFYSPKASKAERNKGLEEFEEKASTARQVASEWKADNRHPDGGYDTAPQAKATNHHPTVKPVKLMQYLVKLVTPKDGTCLDPFNGSGTTGIACKLEGFDYIGIELDPEYVKISEARIAAHEPETQTELV